ncbi:MAG: hypothetical protein ACJAWL_002648 [Motiliproteus sp.]|jgi:hypothetical protein
MVDWNHLAEAHRINAFKSCVKNLQQDPGSHIHQLQVREGMNALALTVYRDQHVKIVRHSTDRWSVVLILNEGVVNTWGGGPYRFFCEVYDSAAGVNEQRGAEGTFKNLSIGSDTWVSRD